MTGSAICMEKGSPNEEQEDIKEAARANGDILGSVSDRGSQAFEESNNKDRTFYLHSGLPSAIRWCSAWQNIEFHPGALVANG